MTLLLAAGRLWSAMPEEFENGEDQAVEAREAVERWDTEGGAWVTEQPAERALDTVPDSERTIPSGQPGEATHDRGEATEE